MISLWAWGSVGPTGSPVFFKMLAHLQYEEMSDQHEQDVAVPSIPEMGLAVSHPEVALALLAVLLDRPAQGRRPVQFRFGHISRSIAASPSAAVSGKCPYESCSNISARRFMDKRLPALLSENGLPLAVSILILCLEPYNLLLGSMILKIPLPLFAALSLKNVVNHFRST
jgi:hypothetical protein